MKRLILLIFVFLSVPLSAIAQEPQLDQLKQRIEQVKKNKLSESLLGASEGVSYILDTAQRIKRGYPSQSVAWQRRAASYIGALEQGRDPYLEQAGLITLRGYRSHASTVRQGYAVYLPPKYDPKRSYPLMVVLHGGSSNGNLFLGVVLGNNMNWKKYPAYLWNEFTPRYRPDWIVVAPDGFGQVMWRWMGEQDVLDVLEDVERHYRIDTNRVVLAGLSNGGVGAYSIGMRHAWRFSAVLCIAGAPLWEQYVGGRPRPEELHAMRIISSETLAANFHNTQAMLFHGKADTGPMRPRFVEQFVQYLSQTHIPHRMTWYPLGHDILYPALRHGKSFESLARITRNPKPNNVYVATGDYRAARQHWLQVTRIASWPAIAQLHGFVDNNTLRINTRQASAFRIYTDLVPFDRGKPVRVDIDGQKIYQGSLQSLGTRLDFHQIQGAWKRGLPKDSGLVKKAGASGPLTDVYREGVLHVYGTQRLADTDALRRSAEKGSRGWPLWLWNFQQGVIADKDLTLELARNHHLVLYGTPGSNSVLERMAKKLPIGWKGNELWVGSRSFSGNVGTRFIYPNPELPSRYIIVQTGVSTQAVDAGHRLPDFLADYVVYDAKQLRSRSRLILGHTPLALGYFDAEWQVGTLRAETLGQPPDEKDAASLAAQEISLRVRDFRKYREEIKNGLWKRDALTVWHPSSSAECLNRLESLGVPNDAAISPVTYAVPTPRRLIGSVNQVRFVSLHSDRDIILSCEMLVRLPTLSQILRKHGIRRVGVMSSYRDHPYESFHTFGLALDLASFQTKRDKLVVAEDFVLTPERPTCPSPRHANRKARTLARLACDLFDSHLFSSVLTPNYNEGHRDHFHLDARPADARLFVR